MSSNTLDLEATIHIHCLEKYFKSLPNMTAEDERISWSAKGLLWYLLSRPKDWKVNVKQLASIYKGDKRGNGIDAIYSMFDELKEAGYIIYNNFKNELGQWQHRYDIYALPHSEFKKMFPDRVKPEVDNAGVVKPDIITRKEVLNKEEKQQQQKTPVVAFPCLKKLEISEYEKEWLSKKHDEETIKHAIAYCAENTPKESYIQMLKFACDKKLKAQKKAEDISIENKKLAEEIKNHLKVPEDTRFEILNKNIEIGYKIQDKATIIEFTCKQFKETLIKAFRDFGIASDNLGKQLLGMKCSNS